MPSRERVNELIEAVVTGDHAEAIARFYTEDATMQELDSEPRTGLANLVARERATLDSVSKVVVERPDFVAIDGDRVAIHWVVEFTRPDGKVRRVDELTMQVWRGDKIARERFFYDRAACGWT
jgi:ketosteroid isomerase-like protein